jgi:glycosyltransferase involved in cell wall biosynthesis
MTDRIVVVIPSYEPDRRLVDLCADLYAAGWRDVLVVNDGSGPAYRSLFAEVHRDFGYPVFVHSVNRGKGRALKNAFQRIPALFPNAIGCVTADSDGQHTPEDIDKCAQALIDEPDRLILGCRKFNSKDVPWKSRFGNELTIRVLGAVCGIHVSDTQTGLRAIPLAYMQKLLDVPGERFSFETNMLIYARDVIEIREVPIRTVYQKGEERVTHFRPVRDSVQIYSLFLKYIFRRLFRLS